MPGRRDSLPFLLLLPNMVTILGLCAGLSAIRFTFEGRFELATGLILFAAVIDGLDGLIARRLRATSEIGAQLDSLSDFLCFGVAPAILVYHFALTSDAGIGWIFALVFSICCCLRLARFNVMRDQPDAPKHFLGVPAPAGAVLGLFPVFLTYAQVLDARSLPVLDALWLGLVGFLMVSRIPTPSLKGVRIPRDKAAYVLVGIALLVGLMLSRFWLLLVLCCIVYLGIVAYGALRRSPVAPR
jgi:CDP-diacylglycerol---serine O-phosphatidyltransferase